MLLPPSLVLLLLLPLSAASSSTNPHNTPHDIVHASCVHANYPNLCLRTLSSYSGPAINTPHDLAQAAVKISLAHAHKVSEYLTTTLSGLKGKREKAALSDCVEQISDSVDELGQTLKELKHLRQGEKFQWQLSNAQTWVSAALTNEETCLDGFQDAESKMKVEVKKKITNVARVTSNALYMINQLHD